MSNKPFVSVIMASYNYAQYLPEAIESILCQTFKDWEMIIVDDCSTDSSVEIIKTYCTKDKRIKLYQQTKNRGLKDAILLGLNKATADWICFLESDDKLANDYLEEKVKITLKEKSVSFIFNDFELIGDNSFLRSDYYNSYNNYVLTKQGFLNLSKEMCRVNCIPTFSVVMLKKNILKNLDFNSPIPQYLDYYLWLQLTLKTKFYFVNKKLTYWRKHKDSYINRKLSPKYKFYFKVGKYFPKFLLNKIANTINIIKIL